MKIITREFVRDVDAGRAAVLWNYWDHEHLVVVHGNYTDAKIIYEDERMAALLLSYRLPLFRFVVSHSLNIMVQRSADVIKAINIGLFGVPILTTIRVTEDRRDHSVIHIRYRFFLLGWRVMLAPFIERMVPRWNERVWQEDLPLKVRRQRVLRLGFQDFYGLPERVEDRVNAGELTFTRLPLSRLKEVNVNAVKNLTIDDDVA